VQDAVHFTYDDHQAATAQQDVPGQPNRIRAIRTPRHKFALYFDPAGKAAPEFEMYDMERDPDERANLVDRSSGEAVRASDRPLRSDMGERLHNLMLAHATEPGTGPSRQSGRV